MVTGQVQSERQRSVWWLALAAQPQICMRTYAYQTISRIIEMKSPVCVTASVLECCYVFYDSIPWCGVQKTAFVKPFLISRYRALPTTEQATSNMPHETRVVNVSG